MLWVGSGRQLSLGSAKLTTSNTVNSSSEIERSSRTQSYHYTEIIMFSLILASDCQNLQVIIKNEILGKIKKIRGIYQIYQIVNDRASWKTDSSAIWFVSTSYAEFWCIGPIKKKGSNKCDIKTADSEINGDSWITLQVSFSGTISIRVHYNFFANFSDNFEKGFNIIFFFLPLFQKCIYNYKNVFRNIQES